MEPLVSILIPCHNAAPFLAETVASARAQTHRKVEIILVDDGSTDGSGVIADGLAGTDLRVIHQKNQGVCSALNSALAHAQGEWIEYLDADDLLHPEKIANQLCRLEEAPRGTIASSSWARFSGDPNGAIFQEEPVWCDMESVEWIVSSWSGGGMMPGCAWLLPRSVVDAAGPWNTTLSLINDLEYFTRVVLASKAVVFCGGARCFYRSNVAGSLSRSRSTAAWRSAFTATQMSAQRLLTRETSERTRRACALNLERLVRSAYPHVPEFTRPAELQVRTWGGAELPFEGGRALRLISKAFGWKAARRLQLLRSALWAAADNP
jgi:glycosyltransferase involved in cell wall biosynthesis